MEIVVEDGTGLPNANSYSDVTEARDFAQARGVTLGNDEAVKAFLISAMDWLEIKSYKGTPTFPDVQALAFPRTGILWDCRVLPGNLIPRALKSAQLQLVVEQSRGLALMPATDGTVVKRKKTDVLEKEFFSAQELGLSGAPVPSFPMVNALLEGLISTSGFALRTRRV